MGAIGGAVVGHDAVSRGFEHLGSSRGSISLVCLAFVLVDFGLNAWVRDMLNLDATPLYAWPRPGSGLPVARPSFASNWKCRFPWHVPI